MKEKKSAAELKALIMRELKQHPEWHDIQDVAITSPARPHLSAASTERCFLVPC